MKYASTSIDCSNVYESVVSGPAIVRAEMFGNIYTSFDSYSYQQFKNDSSLYHYSYLRWPGGSMAEDPTKYSLSSPSLLMSISGQTGQSFREIMLDAHDTGLAMSLIIPTRRYIDPTATDAEKATLIKECQAEFSQFLSRLTSGAFGQIPDDFTLEIGNETSWVGWQTGEYGRLANALLSTFRLAENAAAAAGHPFDIKIAVQLAAGTNQSVVFGKISAENLRVVDGFIRHSGLTESLHTVVNSDGTETGGYDLSYELTRLTNANKYWQEAFSKVGLEAPELNILDTAWSVGPEGSKLTSQQLEKFDVGARQGVATIQLFSQMIASGSDMAAVWGAVGVNPNRYFWHGTQEPVTHGGEALRLLSESLKGTTLLGGKVDSSNNWISSGSNYDTVAFEDEGKVVIFLTSGEIPSGGLNVTVALANIANLGGAIVETIGTQNINDPRSEQRPADPVTGAISIQPNGTFSYTFTQSFQVVRVVISRYPGIDPLDLLDSREPHDIVYGTAADDLLNGADGHNFIFGGLGFDVTSWQESRHSIHANMTGNTVIIDSHVTTIIDIEGVVGSNLDDGIIGNDRANRLSGLNGADNLAGMKGSDSLFGGAGNDTIDGGSENDTLDGGADVDWVNFGGTVSATVNLNIVTGQNTGSGIDTIINVENINSGLGNDRLTGNALNNRIVANEGSDGLYGGAGNDSLYGGTGNDILEGGGNNDLLDGGAGTDCALFTILSAVSINLNILTSQGTGDGYDTFVNIENVITGGGNDRITGNDLANLICTNEGNDTLAGAGGNDTLEGGMGNDVLDGGNGFDVVNFRGLSSVHVNLCVSGAQNTGYGFDTLASIESISSGSGNDRLIGSDTDNSMAGNLGNDILEGGLGNDTLDGGAGADWAVYRGAAPVTANLNLSTFQNTGYGFDVLLSIENISSGNGNDCLTGNDVNNSLEANLGDDRLYGGAGDDILNGGAGNDMLDGGNGIDWLLFDGASSTSVNLSVTRAQNTGFGIDTLISIENISAGNGDDSLTGNAGDNVIIGNVGNDIIYAWGGQDSLYGGDGNDSIYGGDGDDFIFGGKGSDRLSGGSGADTFVFEEGNQIERVYGFSNEDRIDFSEISSISSYSDLILNHTYQSGLDVRIDLGGGELVILQDTSMNALLASNFIF